MGCGCSRGGVTLSDKFWGVCERLGFPSALMSAVSFDWQVSVATVSAVCLLSPELSCRFLVSSKEFTGAWLVVSVVILGDFSKDPVSSLCFVTLGASAVDSEDSPAGVVEKCAIPWLGDEKLVKFGDLFGD